MPATPPGITVIVPTYKRPANLHRCLEGLDRQILKPAEVLVCCREEDMETLAYLARQDRPSPSARPVRCDLPGQVYALTRGIDEVKTEIVAITDDDTVPHPDWLQRIVAHFESDPAVGGVGGKDHVFAYTENDWLEGAEPVVGIVYWNGRTVGNHHFGIGPARYVHMLKGANMSYRKSALGSLRPDARLRGKGAQVGNDMGLSLSLAARGYKLIYDPAVLVDHIIAPRPPTEDRNEFNVVSHGDEAFNRALILLEFLGTQPFGRIRQLAFLAYAGIRGTRKSPGILLLMLGFLTRYPDTWTRFKVTFAAYRDAIRILTNSESGTGK